jgi:hypothetical protein
MNIGDPAMGGQDSVTISDLVTSQEEPVVKREKPKRPPPPIIMSEIKVQGFLYIRGRYVPKKRGPTKMSK